MSSLYKYGNYQYNGPAALKPNKGEVVMFLTQDEAGNVDFVSMLNANITTKMNVSCAITGANPAPILLKDDPEPEDVWYWDSTTNKGSFLWTTQPTYTDGVVIGHIEFIDNYCVRTSYLQTTTGNSLPISQISIISGTVANPTRILSVPYTPGSTFEFCQYPSTATTYTNASCPNTNDGSATISIVFGPSNVAYNWYNADKTQMIASGPSISNRAPGTYHVIVNDTSSMGCTAERTVVISAPYLNAPSVSTTQFKCTVKGTASVTPNGGKGPFTYAWKKGATVIGTASTIFNLDVGSYSVCVMDGCSSQQCANFDITSVGCCGDGICQSNEICGTPGFCAADCGSVCCPPGTIIQGAQCQACPAGSMSTTYNSTSCTSCPANTFNAGGKDTCSSCPKNTASDAGSDKCTPCPAGQVRSTSESSCHNCNPGYYAPPCGGDCKAAPAGSYVNAGDWAPTTCPPGTFSAAGATSCPTCIKDTYSHAGAGSCSSCPSGTSTGSVLGATHILFCQ